MWCPTCSSVNSENMGVHDMDMNISANSEHILCPTCSTTNAEHMGVQDTDVNKLVSSN